MSEDDYRFPTKAEAHEIIMMLEAFFERIKSSSNPIAMNRDIFLNLLFLANPDAFGGSLENAERWLRETVQRVERHESMKRLLADFPTKTAH